jgi:hypothetical protein
MNFEIEDFVSAEKAAMKTTEDLLAEIRDALRPSSTEGQKELTSPSSGITVKRDAEGKIISASNVSTDSASREYAIAPTIKTTDRDGNVTITPQPNFDISTTGAETILSSEDKIKQLTGQAIDNETVLEDRLQESIKTLTEINSGMVKDFVTGIAAGLPVIAKTFGTEAAIAYNEELAKGELGRREGIKQGQKESLGIKVVFDGEKAKDFIKVVALEGVTEDITKL